VKIVFGWGSTRTPLMMLTTLPKHPIVGLGEGFFRIFSFLGRRALD